MLYPSRAASHVAGDGRLLRPGSAGPPSHKYHFKPCRSVSSRQSFQNGRKVFLVRFRKQVKRPWEQSGKLYSLSLSQSLPVGSSEFGEFAVRFCPPSFHGADLVLCRSEKRGSRPFPKAERKPACFSASPAMATEGPGLARGGGLRSGLPSGGFLQGQALAFTGGLPGKTVQFSGRWAMVYQVSGDLWFLSHRDYIFKFWRKLFLELLLYPDFNDKNIKKRYYKRAWP